MDLLRLVLARQPVAKLTTFQKLLQSRLFVQTRAQIYDLPPGDPVKTSVLAGDLCPGAEEIVEHGMLLIRACFLRSSALFLHYSWANRGSLDFWYALGTGIPEIQNEAFRVMMDSPAYAFQLNSIEDEASIPWTSDLKVRFRGLLERLRKTKGILSEISSQVWGIAEIKLTAEQFQKLDSADAIDYLAAWVRSILKYEITTEIVPEVELLLNTNKINITSYVYAKMCIKMGYLHHLMPYIIGLNLDEVTKIVAAAFWAVNYSVLLLVANSGASVIVRNVNNDLATPYSVTVKQAEDARKCLQTPQILQMMGPDLVEYYRIIAGEIFHSDFESSYRMTAGNPGPTTTNVPDDRSISIQGIVIYDPEWIFNQKERDRSAASKAVRYAYARGKWLPE